MTFGEKLQIMEESPSSGLPKWVPLVIGILVISIGLNAVVFVSRFTKPASLPEQSNTTKSKAITTTVSVDTSWKKPESSQIGVPIPTKQNANNQRSFSIYSVATGKLQKINKDIDAGGGGLGLGSSDPLSSPDLLYTAFIDRDSNNLYLLSNETLEETQITKNGGVSYINDWSPDSTKIVYNIGADSIESRMQGQGGPPNKATFSKVSQPGFYIFNIETGENTLLYPISYVEGFIDNNRLLIKPNDQFFQDKLITFNTQSFEANYTVSSEKFGFGEGQYDFAPDGKKWTYTLSRNPTTDANIIYTDFPNKEGETIDSGNWADVQFPKFSPSGKKIAYWRQEGYAGEGIPNMTVWVYDTASKEKKRYADGYLVQWIDENSLLYKKVDVPSNATTYFILDLSSNSSKKVE